MRQYLALFLAIVCISGAYARAGGGGSYRSSSSSSRSSSSSSSRSSSSSSSSSSYRSSGSSSSSSSRPSSSGSSSYRTSSSGPSYSSLTGFKSVTRVYTLSIPGRIALSETLNFDAKSNAATLYRYVPGAPNAPWSFVSRITENDKVIDLEKSADAYQFKFAKPLPGDTTLNFISQLAVVTTPTPHGAFFELEPYCLKAAVCNLKFTGMPAESEVQLLTGAPDNKIAAIRKGENIDLNGTDLRGIAKIRLILSGDAHKTAAWSAWSAADLNTKLNTRIRLQANGVMEVTEDVSYVKAVPEIHLAFLKGLSADNRYLIARHTGLSGGQFNDYSEPHLNLKGHPAKFGYSILNSVLEQPDGKQRIVLPLPALNPKSYYMTAAQTSAGFITERRKITVELPPGVRAKARISICDTVTSGSCGHLKPIQVLEEKSENTISLTAQEAQISGLWMLSLDIESGKLEEPGIGTRMAFAFSHYHTFGKYPRWVFWFYFLGIIGALVLLIWFFILLGKIKRKRLARKKADEAEQNALRDLLKRDPAFDVEAFKNRGRQIAEKIQHAWSAGDMRECRRYLSQGVYNRFRIQLKIMRELEKRQNAMADFKIHAFNIVSRNKSGPFDALVVRLDAEARDTMVDSGLSAAEALSAAKQAPVNGFVEYYSFMRRRDAKTQHGAALDSCSHCGTPFSGEGEITKCKSCGSVMGSGTYDWVLAEITQEVEYKKGGGIILPGKGMSEDRLEDRASFIFWRDVMARVTGKKEYLSRDATDDYAAKPGKAAALSDIAVGAAEIESYNDALSPIQATVRIKWSAKLPKETETRHMESILNLVVDPKHEEGSGFAEHSCAACGGPLPETDAIACSYCQSPIQAKNKDWLLDGVTTAVE